MAESAMAEARRAEAEILRGEWRGALHGVPVALKDLIDTAGVRTTAASALYKDRVPSRDAEVVRRLRQAGAVIVGKNNLHEFAYGGSSLVSYFGDVHNPWDVGRIAGGSSGGSAAAVAAGLAYAAIGTDTAGSIREPAALCGCVGTEADLWAGVEPGSDSAVVVARSCWAAGCDGGRCGGRAAGDCGIRCGGHWFGGCSGGGLCVGAAEGRRGCAWACRANIFLTSLIRKWRRRWSMRCGDCRAWARS